MHRPAPSITRRAFLRGAGGATALAAAGCATTSPRSADGRPNVLFVSVDDLNDWVGFLSGHAATHTPNLDRLAARGVVFEHAYCPVAACHPSRTSTLAGAFPPTTGVYRNADWMTRPFPGLPTLPAWLRAHGYRTLGAGKIFHRSHLTPHALGPSDLWDEYLPFPADPTEDPFPSPLDAPWNGLEDAESFHLRPRWIRQEDWAAVDRAPASMPDGRIADAAGAWLGRRHDAPFFAAVGFYRPHLPWYTPSAFFDRVPETIDLPGRRVDDLADVPEAARQIARGWGTAERFASAGVEADAARAYLASIAFADWCVGRVLDALAAGPNARDTWVVFWSDNGMHTGDKDRWHKGTLWERATRVPVVIAPPAGVMTRHPRIETPISLVDLYPTLCAVTGTPPPDHVEGTDLVPLMAGRSSTRDPVPLYVAGGHRAVRFGRWKYIRYADGSEELYDIAGDRFEFHNLVADPHAADALRDARERLGT